LADVPGIYEIKPEAVEITDVAGCQLKSVCDCDAGSLQIG
jgi:hypothetical protein